MGDMIGGETPRPPSRLRSGLLRAHGRSAAAHCVRRCYETWPELDRLYGRRGRQHAARDAGWHLEHLDEALAAGEPRIFADYADWLAGLLAARGIGPEQVAGAFGFLAEALEAAPCPPGREGERGALLALLRDNRTRLLAADREPIGPPETGPGASAQLAYYECLMGLDREGALELAEAHLADHGDLMGLYVDVLGPVLVRAGREWEAGRLTIAQEHFISEVTREVIRRCGPSGRPGVASGSPVAVACCVPRERHGIGLMMVADALRVGGLAVHLPCESLPAEGVAEAVVRAGADLLCLSCTMEAHLSEASGVIARARRSRPGLMVALGGAALRGEGEDAARRVGADWTAADAREVLGSLPAWCGAMSRRSGASGETAGSSVTPPG